MKENIDQLYNRKLKGVETPPPDDVWENISSRLPKKETKKRIFPFWYKLGGVAATLALLVFLGKDLYSPVAKSEVRLVWQDPSEEIKKEFLDFNFSSDLMPGTTHLLENLILENKKKAALTPDKKNSVAASSKPGVTNFKDILNEPEFSPVAEKVYSFFEHNNAAFQEEMQHQEKRQQEIEKETTAGDLALLNNPDDDLEEDAEKKAKVFNRLSITPTAGAVYSDNMGSGNFIDSNFENNKTSGEISLAYGVQLAYQLTGKLKIRSGIKKVDLSYNTRDVSYASALNAVALGGSGGPQNNAMSLSLASPLTGNLNQRIGFIEVPLEMEFALSDKKLGLNIIAGGSTLFLNNNMVSLNSPDFTTDLGQAQNLNTISYSANIGVGLNYNFSSRLLWNLEPVFKYQVNTFSNTSGVNPYYLGLYSGFSYKF